jgi:hypothetical protein
MIFQIGKIYKMPNNFYFYKSNQPKFWMEYCKKIKIPDKKIEKKSVEINILEVNNSCLEYCKNIVLFPENNEEIISDDESWVDIKKIL